MSHTLYSQQQFASTIEAYNIYRHDDTFAGAVYATLSLDLSDFLNSIRPGYEHERFVDAFCSWIVDCFHEDKRGYLDWPQVDARMHNALCRYLRRPQDKERSSLYSYFIGSHEVVPLFRMSPSVSIDAFDSFDLEDTSLYEDVDVDASDALHTVDDIAEPEPQGRFTYQATSNLFDVIADRCGKKKAISIFRTLASGTRKFSMEAYYDRLVEAGFEPTSFVSFTQAEMPLTDEDINVIKMVMYDKMDL